jgi:ankyrin repeat protein
MSNMNIYSQKSATNDDELGLAQKAQKFYTDAVNLLVGSKPDDEANFINLLNAYIETKNNSMTRLQHTFQEYQSEGKTLLHIASSTGKFKAAEHIIAKCPDVSQIINLEDQNHYTPIINATICESLPLMELLIANGANVKTTNKDGASALNFAAADGSVARMALLVEHGADVNNTSEAGTPIGWASGKGQTDAVRFLIEHKGDVNKTGTAQQVPPVFLAAVASCDTTTALLVDSGADVGALISGNLTLLHICAEGGLTAAVSAILRTDLGQKTACVVNTDGNLPLHLAAMSEHEECMRLLLPFSGPPYSSMPLDDPATSAALLREGAERLAAWHAHADRNKPPSPPSSSSAAVESPEKSADPVAPPMPDLTQLKVSEDDKTQAAAWKDKGNDCYKKSEFAAAIEAYSQGLALDPTNHVIYSNRSACHHALQQHDACLRDAEVCRRLAPHWLKGCFRLATARFALGLFEDAAVAAYEGLQIDAQSEELKSLLQRAVKKGQQEHKAKTAA